MIIVIDRHQIVMLSVAYLCLRPLDCRGEACKDEHNEKGEGVENGYVLAKTRLPASERERQLRRFKRMTTRRKGQVRKKMYLKRKN
jgi:hypothetical protein